MKCPSCGAENLDGVKLCRSCRKPLVSLRMGLGSKIQSRPPLGFREKAQQPGVTRLMADETVDHKTIPEKIKLDYTHGVRDATQKSLEGVQNLLMHFRKSKIHIDDLLQEAANLIWRQFGIDNVAIGLRDPADGLYKYRTMAGFRDDALDAHKHIAYRLDQFFEDGEFKGVDISKYSRIYLAEDNVLTEGERKAYNRPGLLTLKRRSTSESLEGDYIDTRIYGSGDKLLGWIEISGTRTLKLPDATTIRWIETIASIIGAALMCQEAR